MQELGLFGITVPAEYGGLDIDVVSFALVLVGFWAPDRSAVWLL